MKIQDIRNALRGLSDRERVASSQRFFKTGKGEYGEGDQFLGIPVPELRKYARQCKALPLPDIVKLLSSRYHEERLFALLLMVQLYSRSDEQQQQLIFQAYLANTQYINNWDLVDSSTYHILGPHLQDKKRHILNELARSTNLWERRMAIVSTYHFIRQKQFDDTLKIAKLLLKDKEDLIQKAVGWMLREVGNRDQAVEIQFLEKHYKSMPRTMLRYAIEKFDKTERQAFLDGSR